MKKRAVKKYTKAQLKKAFEAGYKSGEYEAAMIDWDRSGGYPSRPDSMGFKTWFKEHFL